MLVYKQSELMSDLLFTVHQHSGDDVTWKPPMHWEMHAVRKLSVRYKIPIWSNSLPLTNASELFWTVSKFMKREWILLLLVYVLHKTWNLAFSRVVVQLTAKKCTKKRDARAKLLFCLVKLLLIWISHRRCILIVIRQKQNILGANSIALADSNPNVFSTHR